jgi:hypothetical protein
MEEIILHFVSRASTYGRCLSMFPKISFCLFDLFENLNTDFNNMKDGRKPTCITRKNLLQFLLNEIDRLLSHPDEIMKNQYNNADFLPEVLEKLKNEVKKFMEKVELTG